MSVKNKRRSESTMRKIQITDMAALARKVLAARASQRLSREAFCELADGLSIRTLARFELRQTAHPPRRTVLSIERGLKRCT
jgi:hypothetical protein